MKTIFGLISVVAVGMITGCKSEVNVIDIAAESGVVCALHAKTPTHQLPIECFGQGSVLPSGNYSTVGDQWQAGLNSPVSLAILGNKGLCVVDEGTNHKGAIKCLDKSTPDPVAPSLLPTATAAVLKNYDFEKVQLSISDQTDFYACAYGANAAGRKTLLCWSKYGVNPIDLAGGDYVAGWRQDIEEILSFSMARDQICVIARTGAGNIADCLVPVISGDTIGFFTSESANYSALQLVGLGAAHSQTSADQVFCWLSAYGDVGCQNIDIGVTDPGAYTGIYLGPKTSPSYRQDATLCMTTSDSVACRGTFADSIMQPEFSAHARHIESLVVTDSLACYLSRPDQRAAVTCQGFQRVVQVPSHLSF